MNMKKMKKFFTLARRHDGFTLVELIVVIAILAILGGVAVPAYSGYVKKANMAADQSLIGEVADALTLYYYSHPNEDAVGYVILRPNGAPATADGASIEESIGAKAMQAVFGENWTETATLKYGSWTDLVANTIGNADVSKSSYVQKGNAKQMMDTVSALTTQLSNKVANSGDPLGALKKNGLLDETQVKEIEAMVGLDKTDPNYDTALTNTMVKYVMNDLGTIDGEDKTEPDSDLSRLATAYVALYGWSLNSEIGAAEMKKVDDAVLSENPSTEKIAGAIMGAYEKLNNGDGTSPEEQDFAKYVAASGETDSNAIISIMNTANGLTESVDMTKPDAFTSDEFGTKLNSYISASKSVGQLALDLNLAPGEIIVFLTADGAILAEYTDAG